MYDGKYVRDHNLTHDEIEKTDCRIRVKHLHRAREITSIYPGDAMKDTVRKVCSILVFRLLKFNVGCASELPYV